MAPQKTGAPFVSECSRNGRSSRLREHWSFREYERACKAGEVKLGKVQVFDLGGLAGGPCWIINFPTKGHWRADSRLTDIEAGLKDLVATIRKLRIRSIAIPPLGCGNGGRGGSQMERTQAAYSEAGAHPRPLEAVDGTGVE